MVLWGRAVYWNYPVESPSEGSVGQEIARTELLFSGMINVARRLMRLLF